MKKSFHKILAALILVIAPLISFAQTQKGQDINGEAAEDLSGASVSMPDEKTLAIGAMYNDGNGDDAGHVRVYSWVNDSWIQKGKDIDGEAAGDESGIEIKMPDSNTIAIGAPFNDGNGTNAGHVRIFKWNGTSWLQKGLDIEGEEAVDKSGWSLAMPDSNTVAIGAPLNNGNGKTAGHVRVFTWNGMTWQQKGLDIEGEAAGDWSGNSVSMPNANTLAVSAFENNGGGKNSGHVRVFSWDGNKWIQKGLDIDGENAQDKSGSSISMPNKNTVAIAAPNNNENSGHVRIFSWVGNTWMQKGMDIEGEAKGDQSGWSVSMADRNTVAISARNNNGNGTASGHVRIYSWDGNSWIQKGIDIDGEAANDYSGTSISMANDNMVAIGAIWNDGNGNNAGHVRVYEICPSQYHSISVQECGSYISPSGATYTNSGIYKDSIQSAAGCDSVITINLIINNTDTSVMVNDTSLKALAQEAKFQWLDCLDAHSQVPNATNALFLPETNGEYAVKITQGNCTDTSRCFAINGVGFANQRHQAKYNIYPNPTLGRLIVKFENSEKSNFSATLLNSVGQPIKSWSKLETNQEVVLNIEDVPSGYYLLKIKQPTKNTELRVIKK